MGKIVYTQTLTSSSTEKINTTGLRDGIYYYMIGADDKVMITGKMAIVK